MFERDMREKLGEVSWEEFRDILMGALREKLDKVWIEKLREEWGVWS